jgi:2-dehydropantoate 2-reductase
MGFLIIGPGAMGCLFAARLKESGRDVTLLDYNEQRAETINSQGIIVEGIMGEFNVQVPVVTKEIPAKTDFVIVCVKSHKTLEAAQRVKPFLSKDTVITTLQNGIGNTEILNDIFGKERVLGGVTSEGATSLGWGKIRHAGQGSTIFGPRGILKNALEQLVTAFNKAGFKTDSADNVEGLIWGKLIINVGINALTAITGLKNGDLPDHQGTRLIMEKAVEEAAAVAKAKKIDLPFSDPMARVLEVCRATAGNIASMLQDVMNKKWTEVDYINGAIVKEGRNLNIPTPVNQTLTCLVQTIHETYDIKV